MSTHHRSAGRCVQNPFNAFPNPTDESEAARATVAALLDGEAELKANMQVRSARLLRNIVRDDPPVAQPKHADVHSGHAGHALLFFKAYQVAQSGTDIAGFEPTQLLNIAENYIDSCLLSLPDTRWGNASTFLTGSAGIYAVAAVILSELGRVAELTRVLTDLEALTQLCECEPEGSNALTEVADELLYGRSGFLYAMLWVFARRDSLIVSLPDKFLVSMRRVFDNILTSGINCAALNATAVNGVQLPPLVWVFHNKLYLGAGHGIAGILHVLLQTLELTNNFGGSVCPDKMDLIWNTVDYVRQQRLLHGNYPSTVGSQEDVLVQICHGAPGVVIMLAHAVRQNVEVSIVELMSSAATIWMRGLLTKGNGLCHGSSGNAYAFLALYRATKMPAFRLAAEAFATHVVDDVTHTHYRPADRPNSFFEGLGGVAYFLLDALSMEAASLPGLEV